MAKVFITKVTAALEEHFQQALSYLEWEKHVPSNARVFFKPNLTYPSPKPGVTTTPEFIEAVLRVFSTRTPHLIIGESDGGYRGWPAEISFKSHCLPDICKRYGARLVNLSQEQRTTVKLKLGKGTIFLNLPEILLTGIDVFVTLPVPKIHQITVISGAIKNQWGCIPDDMRLVNHPYFDEMVLEINRLVGTRLALADGTYFLNRNGPMFGQPIRMNLLIASDNIGAMDATLCQIMGLDTARIRYLSIARNRGLIPPEEQIEYNTQLHAFCSRHFHLKRTLRNRIVCWAFDRPWAITLFWNSRFADLFHKLLYAITGNLVRDKVNQLQIISPETGSVAAGGHEEK